MGRPGPFKMRRGGGGDKAEKKTKVGHEKRGRGGEDILVSSRMDIYG